MGLSLVLEYT